MGAIILKGTPTKKQAQFMKSKKRHVAFGGGRGCGKDWAMRRKFVMYALAHPGTDNLIVCYDLGMLIENYVKPLFAELVDIAEYDWKERVFEFDNGSTIRLGYLHNWNPRKAGVEEIDILGIANAQHFSKNQILRFRMHGKRHYYTISTGGEGREWVKEEFVNNSDIDTEFIHATVYDNPHMMKHKEGYVKALEALPEPLKRACLHGDFDVDYSQGGVEGI